MAALPFERCVFINCPFDDAYDPILQAILFCVLHLGFEPRIASERFNSAENRLAKIRELIEASKYSIHDLSRCQAKRRGEDFRLNMPFELGIDYGCRAYFGSGREEKTILILEEKPFRYQAAISDLSGCDIQAHGGDFERAVRKVRNWLVSEAGAPRDAPTLIIGKYADFQKSYVREKVAKGFSMEDIRDYPTVELLDAMREWIAAGEPV